MIDEISAEGTKFHELKQQRLQVRRDFIRVDLDLATLLADLADKSKSDGNSKRDGNQAEYKNLKRLAARVCTELQEFLIKYRGQLAPGDFKQAEEQLSSLLKNSQSSVLCILRAISNVYLLFASQHRGAPMRGEDAKQEAMFSYVSPEKRVPQDHPLRPIREMVDTILQEMSPRFERLYADVGRPSIAPERLLRALLLQIFYSVRSERLLMEQLDYNLLFRWFVGMQMDERVWNHAVFSKNRERLLNHEVAEAFFARVLKQAKPYLSDEHFTVDGTLLEAWASQKSFRSKQEGEPPTGTPREADFHGEERKNQTHQSTTDPEARLYKKSKGAEAKLSYLGHVLMENRNGLLVRTMVTQADGTAERDAALLLAWKTASQMPDSRRITLGGDKNYDTHDFVTTARGMRITPHVAQNDKRRGGSAIDARTTRHAGYAISQQKRKRVEQSFGWMKMIGLLRKVKLRGLRKVSWWFTLVGAAYNLVRLRRLRAEAVA